MPGTGMLRGCGADSSLDVADGELAAGGWMVRRNSRWERSARRLEASSAF